MGCTSCGTQKNGMPTGCGDKGHCASGGCNKMNTYDWLTVLDLDDPQEAKLAEVSFKYYHFASDSLKISCVILSKIISNASFNFAPCNCWSAP